MDQLARLALLIKERNAVEVEITEIIKRPMQMGHMGEYIAKLIFDLTLYPSVNTKGSDGYFNNGPLAGRTVNVKWYGKSQYILDINPKALPDYYLVLTGPTEPPASAKGAARPWVIEKVYLFESIALLQALAENIKLGIATSVKKALWDEAEIYPTQHEALLPLTDAQRAQLALFGAPAVIPSDISKISSTNPNGTDLYPAIEKLFVDDSFAEEVDAYVQAVRQRERDEAAKEGVE